MLNLWIVYDLSRKSPFPSLAERNSALPLNCGNNVLFFLLHSVISSGHSWFCLQWALIILHSVPRANLLVLQSLLPAWNNKQMQNATTCAHTFSFCAHTETVVLSKTADKDFNDAPECYGVISGQSFMLKDVLVLVGGWESPLIFWLSIFFDAACLLH